MKKASSKEIFGRCFYHLCRKREELFNCRFCNEKFCKEHLKPRPAGFPRFKDSDPLSQVFMDEYHKKGGHPCLPYTNSWYKEIEKKKQEEDKAFNDFLNKSKKISHPLINNQESENGIYHSKIKYGENKREKTKSFIKHENRNFTEKIKSYSNQKIYNFKDWLKEREYYKYEYNRRIGYFIKTILFFVASIVGFNIFYSNAQKLNEINLWIVKIGGVLILLSLFFAVKFGWRLFKEIVNIIKRQKNWLKYLIIILIILLLWQAYSNKDTVLNPVLDVYNKTNFSLFKPVSFGDFSSNYESNGIDNFFGIEPPSSNIIEQGIFTLTNQERQRYGLKPLIFDSQLTMIAREHSEDMYQRNFFDHTNPDGDGPTERAKAKGIRITNGNWIGIAENIGQTPIGDVIGCGYTYNEEDIAECAISGWMSSPGHRANILDENYDVIGVGTYCTTSNCWNTQNFR